MTDDESPKSYQDLLSKRAKEVETLDIFEAKIHYAKMNGDRWVETSPEIIKFFNRGGLNGADYFIYKDIRVCETGKSASIDEKEAIPMDTRLHGDKEARVVGTPA